MQSKKILTKKDANVATEKTEKQSCGICEEPLDSDAEDENEKNVGCDTCPRWYHMGCTQFNGLKYSDVQHKDFICDFCEQA